MKKPAYWICRWLAGVAFKARCRFRIHNRGRFIGDGPAILAANHASYFDPPAVGVAAPTEVYFLARKTLFQERPIGWLLPFLNVIPVDLGGRDISAIKTLIRLISEGNRVVVFPEGTRTPDGELQPAQPGVGLIVAKTMAPVVPIYISGTYEAFGRNMKKPKAAPIEVYVGEPLRFCKEDIGAGKREDYARIGDRIMQAIAELRPVAPVC